MEDRSKRTETVRPQVDGCCEQQRECDRVLSSTKDEDMVDGEMGFDDGTVTSVTQANPSQPTVKEPQEAHDHASTVQIMVQILCDGTMGERTAQKIRRAR